MRTLSTAAPTAQTLGTCPRCGKPAAWAIGPTERSCTKDLGRRLEEIYRADPRPFQPHLPTPLKRGHW